MHRKTTRPNLRLHLTRLSCAVVELAGPAAEVSAGGSSPQPRFQAAYSAQPAPAAGWAAPPLPGRLKRAITTW